MGMGGAALADRRSACPAADLPALCSPALRCRPPTSRLPQVSEVVLTQLEDASGDISGLAVKWCAALRGRAGCCDARRPAGLLLPPLVELSRAGLMHACTHACILHRLPPLSPPPQPPLHTPITVWSSLGQLVNKNRTEQLQEVVAALCAKLLSGAKEQQRDVAALGLKTVVAGALPAVARAGCCSFSRQVGRSCSRRQRSNQPPPSPKRPAELSPKKAATLVGTATPKLIEGLRSEARRAW